PIANGTSHLALTHVARLRAGETLFVTGAAGGVGLTAVEIGKRLGARVIASARGAERLAVAQGAGADVLIDSEAEVLKDRLRAEGGVDVVYDAVGGPAFDQALRACRPEGRLLAIGFASGQVPQVPANLLLVKNLTVSGFWYGGFQAHAPALVAASMSELLRWRAEGSLRPHIGQVLPFDAFPEGLELLRTRRATGKVVIRVQLP
ncbi:MAG: zinc-binding dehydrogenase, partial [Rhodobacterales bacterium]|nr:zinc-binding dehydrogenase [Rhodobacterales bacterium]